jgi:protein-disulfide isomerase
MTVGLTVQGVLDKYKGKGVKVVNKHYVVHPQVATLPAYAACAAGKQGKWAEWDHMAWEKMWPKGDQGPRMNREALGAPALEAMAAELKLDVNKFKADMNGPECKAAVQEDQKQMQAIGVNGTPSIFINGKPYVGQRTVEAFSAVIDAEIAKADAAIKGGAKVEDYYDSLMKNAKKTL